MDNVTGGYNKKGKALITGGIIITGVAVFAGGEILLGEGSIAQAVNPTLINAYVGASKTTVGALVLAGIGLPVAAGVAPNPIIEEEEEEVVAGVRNALAGAGSPIQGGKLSPAELARYKGIAEARLARDCAKAPTGDVMLGDKEIDAALAGPEFDPSTPPPDPNDLPYVALPGPGSRGLGEIPQAAWQRNNPDYVAPWEARDPATGERLYRGLADYQNEIMIAKGYILDKGTHGVWIKKQ